MNSKRSFLKKITFLFLLTIFPVKLSQKLITKNKFLKKKFSKIWILSSDDI
tara:strand:- start:881 stop:1033 length:153 start_codon:yes stop_codon:yes gene_type:complete